MKRYTYMRNGHWHVKVGQKEVRSGFVDRLAEYENIGMTPEEIVDQLEMFRAYRHVCGGRTPEFVAQAIAYTEQQAEEEKKRATMVDTMEDQVAKMMQAVQTAYQIIGGY